MRICIAVFLMFMFATAAHAQYMSLAIDFFLHDRNYDTFLRDYFRFKEPKPLRIEYWHVNWRDSDEDSISFTDQLHLEGLIPIYFGEKVLVDIPFQYSHVPIWAENDRSSFGDRINVLEPYLMTRWTLSERFKAIVGWEYNLKGDSEHFGNSIGRKICLLKSFFSYDLHRQLNLAAGGRLDRYYYDTDGEPTAFELADRLYYQPAIMLNWHPSQNLIFLLGIPHTGVHLKLGNVLKAEARVGINEKAEVALSISPVERIIATFRFFNTPYIEVPVEIEGRFSTEWGGTKQQDTGVGASESDEHQIGMLHYTDKSILLEIGYKLNPAALASLGFRYSLGGDVELKDRANEKTIEELDGKTHFSIGATFTMGLEALLGMR